MNKGQADRLKELYKTKCNALFEEKLDKWFLRTPTIWYSRLMEDEGAKHSEGGIYKAVPPSFWKFLHVLWRELMWPRPEKWPQISANLSLRQFGMEAKLANLWATALVAGGLITVNERGTFSSRRASTYFYNTEADAIMWQGFYRGLMMAHAEWKSVNREWVRNHGGEPRMADWAKSVRFRVEEETALLRKELHLE
jgi:hypothetical protein